MKPLSVEDGTKVKDRPMPSKSLWIIMFYGCNGWLATGDYSAVWRTKGAADRKIAEINKPGLYQAFKFEPIGGRR